MHVWKTISTGIFGKTSTTPMKQPQNTYQTITQFRSLSVILFLLTPEAIYLLISTWPIEVKCVCNSFVTQQHSMVFSLRGCMMTQCWFTPGGGDLVLVLVLGPSRCRRYLRNAWVGPAALHTQPVDWKGLQSVCFFFFSSNWSTEQIYCDSQSATMQSMSPNLNALLFHLVTGAEVKWLNCRTVLC